MKKNIYFLAASLMIASTSIAQIPTNGLIFEHHFEGNYNAALPANAVIDLNASYNYQLGPDVNGIPNAALELFLAEGAPKLVYNNVVNDIQTTNSNNQGITMYCNAKFDSTFLANEPVNSYHSILTNGQQFIRILKTTQSNPYTIQFGVYDGNTESGTFGYTVTGLTTSLAEITKWKGYALTYYTNSSGGILDGYYGNFLHNHLEMSSAVGLTFGVADTNFHIGTNIQNMAFQGWIDDVLIYERALSGAEIDNINNLFGTASVADNELLNLTVYPNPSADYLSISTDQAVNYSISSMIGNVVAIGKLSANESISIEALEKGHYFINVELDGKKQNIPFVKN